MRMGPPRAGTFSQTTPRSGRKRECWAPLVEKKKSRKRKETPDSRDSFPNHKGTGIAACAIRGEPRRIRKWGGEGSSSDYEFGQLQPPPGCPPRHSAPYLLAPPKFRLNRRRARSSDSTQTKG